MICLICHIMHYLNITFKSLAVSLKYICVIPPHATVKIPLPLTAASARADPYPSVQYVSCVTYCFPIPNKVAE